MRPTSIAIPFLITCTTIYKATAICESEDQDGLCSNVFRKGCLREIAARRRRSLRLDRPNGEDLKTDNITFDVRVCNSDDLAIAAENRSDHCRDATFDYTEIRFAPGKVSFSSCNIVQIPLMSFALVCSNTTSPLPRQLRQAIGILPYS
jgi:hypothetical protein